MRRFGGREVSEVLWTLTLLLIVTWLWGVVSGQMLGGIVHLLLPLAIVTALMGGRRSRRAI
jgi:hypothetical protein